ncbi:unnamed protein product [Cochlearia groenlandica]
MAFQTMKKTCSILMIVVIVVIMFVAQISQSTNVEMSCVKDCVVNQCMKASKKATPTICNEPCSEICDPINGRAYVVPKGGRDPIKAFCDKFSWICSS